MTMHVQAVDKMCLEIMVGRQIVARMGQPSEAGVLHPQIHRGIIRVRAAPVGRAPIQVVQHREAVAHQVMCPPHGAVRQAVIHEALPLRRLAVLPAHILPVVHLAALPVHILPVVHRVALLVHTLPVEAHHAVRPVAGADVHLVAEADVQVVDADNSENKL